MPFPSASYLFRHAWACAGWIVGAFMLFQGFLSSAEPPQTTAEAPQAIIVIGAPGEAIYGDQFSQWANHWILACKNGGVASRLLGVEGDGKNTLSLLRTALAEAPHSGPAPLWLVLLGHGSFDGAEGKFNLAGDDLSSNELAALLAPLERPQVIVCAFSASGAFLPPLSRADRVIVTATKSGAEKNFSRFGGWFSEAIADPSADLDKDGQVSVLEAWLAAARRTADFYNNEGRLATEHSLLDDNGDRLGTPADWFKGARLVKKPSGGQIPDGRRAQQLCLQPRGDEQTWTSAQRAERDSIEMDLARLRDAKSALPENEYFSQLEALLLRLARFGR